jgi:hypothetical protein
MILLNSPSRPRLGVLFPLARALSYLLVFLAGAGSGPIASAGGGSGAAITSLMIVSPPVGDHPSGIICHISL